MAEQRLERDLRAALAAELDPVHGPDPRWSDAPVARLIASDRGGPSRWRTAALLVAAAVGAVVLAVVAVAPRDVPVATAPPTTIEPWPTTIGPSATPTSGEVPLGRVAVATAYGAPALLVRVSPGTTQALDSVGITIEIRVVGQLDRAVGVDRFLVVRGGHQEAPGLEVTGADPLAIAVDAPVGTQVSATFSIPAAATENVDLAYAGSGPSITFRYPVHRATAPPSLESGCPTLDDYALASLRPSVTPARPSFDPVSPEATPSTGVLAPGQAGIVPAPDGSPGAHVRVSNIRFCDRLPAYRPDAMGGPAKLLLADVEIAALKDGALPQGFIPGHVIVVANYGGRFNLNPATPPLDMPGANSTTTLETGPGFVYRGTMVWEVPDSGARVTLDAQRAGKDSDGTALVQFSYLAREGTESTIAPATPAPTSDPAATPTVGTARPGDTVILGAQGGTMPLVVRGVDQVPRYPGLAPTSPAEAFMEIGLVFGPGSGTFSLDAADWVVVGPDGATLPLMTLPETREGNDGLPNFWTIRGAGEIPPDFPQLPQWLIAEVPADGGISLQYRPDGGPALVTWVLREG